MKTTLYSIIIVVSFIVSINCQSTQQHHERKPLNLTFFVQENCHEDSRESHKIIKSIEKSMDCLEFSSLMIYLKKAELNTVAEIGNLLNLSFHDFGYANHSLSCFDSQVNIYQKCLSKLEIQQTKTYRGVLKRFSEYMCLQGGFTVARIFVEPDINCMKNNYVSLKNCIKSTLRKYRTFNMPSKFINDNNCWDLRHLKTCVVPIMKSCEDQFLADFTEGLINTIIDELSCEYMFSENN